MMVKTAVPGIKGLGDWSPTRVKEKHGNEGVHRT